MNKKLILALYTFIMVCIGFATIMEKYHDTGFVREHIYGAWWFSTLWAILTVASCACFFKQRLYKRFAVMLLHLSFVVILAGALVTQLFARSGVVTLRTGLPAMSYVDHEGNRQPLPFSLTLKEFRIVNYPGTDAPLDYQSVIQTTGGDTSPTEVLVSMNHIGHIGGYRFFQSSFDSDGQGVLLGVGYDPYGIAVTYCGYLLLLVGIIATLLSRKTRMRTLYRKAMQPLAILLVLASYASPLRANDDLQTVDKDIAHRMGAISVLYNNRICPLNTVATDFVTKLSGKASWKGYSADEIFTSWMIYYSPWEKEKMIRVKNRDVQRLLGIDGQWACYSDFLDEYKEYKLKKAVEDMRNGDGSIPKKGLMEADEKFGCFPTA